MKHIKMYEDFSKEQIKKMLLKAQKNSQIDIKVNIDDLINNLKEPKDRTDFEQFVDDEAKFISAHDESKMGEYIQKFKELGLNTSKIERLYPDFLRYQEIHLKEIDDLELKNYGLDSEDEDEEEHDKELELLYDEMDKLEPSVKELENEARILAKKAKKLYDNKI